MRKEFTFENQDKLNIHVYKWMPERDIKGIVQIAHGMNETALRYDYFARKLVEEGFVVYANDHRGHGQSALSIEELGYVSDDDGFHDMVEDMKQLTDLIKQDYPRTPILLFGHSMGSFLAQRYIQLYNKDITAVLLSGTNGKPKSLLNVGVALSKSIMILKGRKANGKLLDHLMFGAYNNRFKPITTEFDWLTRDANQVQAYIDDPYCGNVFPVSFFYDLLRGLKTIHKQENMKHTPLHLPMYFFGGSDDPVSEYGKGIVNLYETYQSVGVQSVTYKLYEGGRHEMLNEQNRDEVIQDLISWIQQHVAI
ncbi:alpha/beta hydrolase [Metabacillus iocasae]|uniref:Alpha-beta hydrolase superfamily lysophospholipase n=1 Tax=Priestia iocasae TaxID=2291674 RepID=A0ABS2QXW4_9BACI|nr:alpha/beta hydrolase [Metabacillus iocasae]MBM7703576.1 alpha-beta hydrolase superfamily lysophospholipase [Metabacillus iocasae]